MSGLAGIYGINPNRDELTAMTEQLTHRGTAVVEEGAAGERSFLLASLSTESQMVLDEPGPPAAVEPTFAAHMAFDGRLFNRDELQGLLAPCASPDLETDAELLLRLYDERGPDCFSLIDGDYALAVTDPTRGLVLARDPLGARPLYAGHRDGHWYFASEVKALGGLALDYRAVQPGCWQQPGHDPVCFDNLEPEPSELVTDLAEATAGVLERLRRAVQKRLAGTRPIGVYLSGGLDSSLIAALAVEQCPGLHTFAVGMANSADIEHARLCAEHLGTSHHEFIYTTQDMVDVLPEVIRCLETYDAPLVRSAVPNYFLARLAACDVSGVLSGEGADELFAGYANMTGLDSDALRQEMRSLLRSLHQLGLQRGDRMSMAHGIEAFTPFLDRDVRAYALRLIPDMNFGPDGEEKWILRLAASDLLPEDIVWRRKQKFSQGAGSANRLAEIAESFVSDAELADALAQHGPGHRISGKEELMYYRLFKRCFPESAAEQVIGFSAGF